jgi:predicted transposase YbfD/YdcC
MKLRRFLRYAALLDINGCIITIDAMGTQTDIAAQIVERKAAECLKPQGKSSHPLSAGESVV